MKSAADSLRHGPDDQAHFGVDFFADPALSFLHVVAQAADERLQLALYLPLNFGELRHVFAVFPEVLAGGELGQLLVDVLQILDLLLEVLDRLAAFQLLLDLLLDTVADAELVGLELGHLLTLGDLDLPQQVQQARVHGSEWE